MFVHCRSLNIEAVDWEEKAMDTRAELETRLKDIETKIRETQERLPAHSTKPPLMITLFALEDEREAILSQLKSIPTNH